MPSLEGEWSLFEIPMLRLLAANPQTEGRGVGRPPEPLPGAGGAVLQRPEGLLHLGNAIQAQGRSAPHEPQAHVDHHAHEAEEEGEEQGLGADDREVRPGRPELNGNAEVDVVHPGAHEADGGEKGRDTDDHRSDDAQQSAGPPCRRRQGAFGGRAPLPTIVLQGLDEPFHRRESVGGRPRAPNP